MPDTLSFLSDTGAKTSPQMLRLIYCVFIFNFIFSIQFQYFNIRYFNLFAVELSLSSNVDRVITKTVIAGSAVSFNCTLDESCVNQSIYWHHYSAPDNRKLEQWYRRSRYHDILEGRGVTVEEDAARGWSVLRIPSARVNDSGRFLCRVSGSKTCQMDFQLTVTGNIC